MDSTTDKKKRRRSVRRWKRPNDGAGSAQPDSRGSSVAPPAPSALEDALRAGEAINGSRRSDGAGAPMAPSPLSAMKSRPATPVDLAGAAASPAELPDGRPGGRRSRAFATVEAEPRPKRPLTVVDGGGELGLEEDPEDASRSLSPSTATSIGDFAAAMTGPLAGALYLNNVAVFIATALLVLLVRAQARRSALSEGEVSGMSPVVAAVGVFVLSLAVDWSAGVSQAVTAGAAALAAGGGAAVILKLLTDRFVHVRVAVIGDAARAHDLAWEIAREGVRRYSIVGYVTRTTERDNLRDLSHVSFKVRRLGLLSDLSHIVARNDIDLLVLASDQDRLKVFERATVCAERYRTRLIGLTAFEEAVFRRVPVEGLNVAWFQHIMHPRFRPAPRFVTRATDIFVAALIGVVTTPVWLFTAAFIKVAFGAPVLVRRRRVGERGSSFSVLRFRVAANEESGAPPAEDVPAAGFGKFLRRTRIEAIPQLLNVLRGDMSLVGPEPEAPKHVGRVEQELEFYGRRHLVRPGLTGWAQLHRIRGDERDDAATLGHDLFYLKHQSLLLYYYVLLAAIWHGMTGGRRRAAV